MTKLSQNLLPAFLVSSSSKIAKYDEDDSGCWWSVGSVTSEVLVGDLRAFGFAEDGGMDFGEKHAHRIGQDDCARKSDRRWR